MGLWNYIREYLNPSAFFKSSSTTSIFEKLDWPKAAQKVCNDLSGEETVLQSNFAPPDGAKFVGFLTDEEARFTCIINRLARDMATGINEYKRLRKAGNLSPEESIRAKIQYFRGQFEIDTINNIVILSVSKRLDMLDSILLVMGNKVYTMPIPNIEDLNNEDVGDDQVFSYPLPENLVN
jgi:hypothetical protein